jgi:hypothetical protein
MTGLPCPPDDAPNARELWAEWEVASNFLRELNSSPDKPEAAKLAAAEYTLRNHAWPIEQLTPHIERALGRKLLADEIASGMLYA